ncbi:MAG: DUF3179 domain-containing protein [Chitinophagaceae bacterium]|nr:DUF3179 domain-containing protein [Chitinophagaceae bacterium]
MTKRLFYFGVMAWILFEILSVYLIMPMPGSQQMDSISVAYIMNHYRWWFRMFFAIMMLIGLKRVMSDKLKGIPILFILIGFTAAYFFNVKMRADRMFLQPQQLLFGDIKESTLPEGSLVLTLVNDMEAKAFPIRYLAYHHQVRDFYHGEPVMVTYCSVCRSGRVYSTMVDSTEETFSLAGMDHFNALFEDKSTGSWWRQANGECVAGAHKGKYLREIFSRQMTIKQFFSQYPDGQMMLPDPASIVHYDNTGKYESGESRSLLTGTDTASWQRKSWILGIVYKKVSKAYDWNQLKRDRLIEDQIAGQQIIIILAKDGHSFNAFEVQKDLHYTLVGDMISDGQHQYSFSGVSTNDQTMRLKSIPVYQEFWHSWKTFHPKTLRSF